MESEGVPVRLVGIPVELMRILPSSMEIPVELEGLVELEGILAELDGIKVELEVAIVEFIERWTFIYGSGALGGFSATGLALNTQSHQLTEKSKIFHPTGNGMLKKPALEKKTGSRTSYPGRILIGIPGPRGSSSFDTWTPEGAGEKETLECALTEEEEGRWNPGSAVNGSAFISIPAMSIDLWKPGVHQLQIAAGNSLTVMAPF